MAPKVYRSLLPDLELAQTDFLQFIFSNPFNTAKEKSIYIDSETKEYRTYAQVVSLTKRLAEGFRQIGLCEDDVVALFSPNTIDYAIICYGVIGNAAIISPMSAALTVSELQAQLKTCEAKFLVVHSSLLAIASNAIKGLSIQVLKYGGATSSENDTLSVEKLIQKSTETELASIPPAKLAEKTAFMCFSSGTTGSAKGVMSTHRNMTSNLQQWSEQHWKTEPPGGCFVAFLPFSHIYPVAAYLCLPMLRGITTVVLPKFDLANFLRKVEEYKPRILHLVPPIVLRLAKDPTVEKYNLSSVTGIASAAAPLSLELANAVEQRFSKLYGTRVHCYQAWGTTETSPLIAAAPTDGSVKKPGVGFLTPNMEMRLVDPETLEDSISTPFGTTGPAEIWVRGPNVTKGYYRNEEANRSSFILDGQKQRWYRTGDIGTIDAEGWIDISDRIKDMIKYKGLQVIPSELEAKLLEHPRVSDCCVVGWYDDTVASELPVAFVVSNVRVEREEDIRAFTAELHTWLNARVSNHKRLRGGIRLVEAIQKSPSGKILRRDMKKLLGTEIGRLSKL